MIDVNLIAPYRTCRAVGVGALGGVKESMASASVLQAGDGAGGGLAEPGLELGEGVSARRDAPARSRGQSLEDLKSRGMIYNELPPDDLTKIQERLNPVLDKFTKEVGEDLVKQTRVELEKVENRSRSLRGSSRPFAGGRESALNARACYMREGRLAHPTYTTATADLFRGLLANAGDLDHSGLLVELERRNGIQN